MLQVIIRNLLILITLVVNFRNVFNYYCLTGLLRGKDFCSVECAKTPIHTVRNDDVIKR